ncbi:MAG: phosphate acyltransferase PlsX [Deltaproteobacteria bacterium]|nr:MAG: phosphate acyltransferase PlsX [Deltaproteobacteria bacterium]
MNRIAVDAMGSDLGPEVMVAGAASCSIERADIHTTLVGDLDAMRRALDARPHNSSRLRLVSCEGFISQDDDPRSVRERPHCSVCTAASLVAQGEADALVSAGNTGALILAASLHLPRIEGIRRAALAAVHPTERRHGPKRDPFALILDVGATSGADAEALRGFAAMGVAYSSIVSEIEAPRVALLSNGSEPQKGTPEIVQAHQLLAQGPLNFAGNVEGLDIPRGTVDVVVCDGFLGNVVLKMLEGVGDSLTHMARQAAARRLEWRIGMQLLGDGLKQLRRMTDWKAYGGAPLLGLEGVVIKAHGRSEGRAVRNAIKVAAKNVRGDLIGRISEQIARA